MRIREKVVLLIVIINLCFHLRAQEKWSLNDCINYAIKNNLQIQDALLNERTEVLNYRQSKWNLLPGISAGSNAGMNYGKSVDPNTNTIINTSFFNNSYGVGAGMELFHGFMLQNQIRYQKFRKESASNSRIKETDDLAFEVMNAFYNVTYYEALLTIANEQKDLSELNVKKTQKLIDAGLKAETDLLEVKANLEKDILFCVQTSNNIEASNINLRKAMNLPDSREINLSMPEMNEYRRILCRRGP